MMYLAGLSYRFIGTLIAILVPVTIILSVLLYSQISHFCTIISKSVFWHGWNRRNMQGDEAYQQNNAIMAIGSGQLTGKGLNNNTTTSVKNGNFISEPQTDFILQL